MLPMALRLVSRESGEDASCVQRMQAHVQRRRKAARTCICSSCCSAQRIHRTIRPTSPIQTPPPQSRQQDTIVAVRRAGARLAVANLEAEKFPPADFSADPDQAVDTANHTWANYFLAAYKGVFDHLRAKGGGVPAPAGLEVMVHGVVPLGGGLSSSAAIVVSSALAVLGAHGVALTKGEVADFACKAER